MKERNLAIVGWEWRLFIRGHKEALGMMDVFSVFIVVMILRVYAYIKTHEIIHFKYEQLIVCQLYINKAVKRETGSGNHLRTEYIVPFMCVFYRHLLNFLTFSWFSPYI